MDNLIAPLDVACQEFSNHDNLKTWLSDWQLENNRVSPIQCRTIIANTMNLLRQVEALETELSVTLASYFPSSTCEEWLGTFLVPIKKRLNDIVTKANQNFSSASPETLP